MGLFGKKKGKERDFSNEISELPKLPEFPKLTDLGENSYNEKLPQLPSFPNNSFGRKFSQDAIKDVVTGENKGEEVFDANEFAEEDEEQMMQRKPLGVEMGSEGEIPKEFSRITAKTRRNEPVFVRLDKFEEALDLFEKAKDKISDIEKLLREINSLKEQEEAELQYWTNEINLIKQQIEKIDQDIFSKLD